MSATIRILLSWLLIGAAIVSAFSLPDSVWFFLGAVVLSGLIRPPQPRVSARNGRIVLVAFLVLLFLVALFPRLSGYQWFIVGPMLLYLLYEDFLLPRTHRVQSTANKQSPEDRNEATTGTID